MSALPFNEHFENASRCIFGTMNLGGGWNSNPVTKEDESQAHHLLETCIEAGINVIDLADIYTFGKAEEVMGRVFKKNKHFVDHFIIQSKIGIRLVPDVNTKHYDLSPRWVTEAVHASLKRLNIEQLDVLFLHRPDPLMQIEKTAETLNNLYKQEKFEYLAVSNMHAGQTALIQNHVEMPVIANQLEMSLLASDFVEDSITSNMQANTNQGFPRGTLEYCLQQKIQLQAWSALAQGQFGNTEHPDKAVRDTANLLAQLAENLNTNVNALVLAWLMKHPTGIQPVIGSTKPERILEAAKAGKLELSREQWYQILETRRGEAVP
uniref:aldo/keto reductase n=1 Tax=Ningiella ruwaisensis TaxID=2364274 RepID=UPI00109F929D|nr:aldo/keto reductase [Ningiella ruwaisensis]